MPVAGKAVKKKAKKKIAKSTTRQKPKHPPLKPTTSVAEIKMGAAPLTKEGRQEMRKIMRELGIMIPKGWDWAWKTRTAD